MSLDDKLLNVVRDRAAEARRQARLVECMAEEAADEAKILAMAEAKLAEIQAEQDEFDTAAGQILK